MNGPLDINDPAERCREPRIDISIFEITLGAFYDLKYILDNRHSEIILLGSFAED